MALDYTDFAEKGSGKKKRKVARERAELRWWLLKGIDQANSITAALDIIAKSQNERLRQSIVSARLYGNMSVLGPNGVSFSKMATLRSGLHERISYNVVASAIDTIHSKTTKNKPMPFFVTSGGDYKAQRRAKKLNKFVEGLFYEQNAHAKGGTAMRDGCVFNDGLVHVFERDDRVMMERVLPQEIWVDDADAFYGNPRCLHYCVNADRQTVIERWPKFENQILDADPIKVDNGGSAFGTTADLVQVRESWHLPSGPEAKDGKHVISVDRCVLFEEPWTRDHFPFAKFTWWPKMFGWWGQGLAEQLQNIQMEINKLLNVIQRSFHLGGTFKVLIENGSKVVKEHLNNDVGAIITYTGTRPEYIVPPLVPPEIYGHLRTLKDAAYEQAGISQLSAASKKPEGLDSGRALREFNNIESERFVAVGHAYEQFYLDLAKLAVETAKDIAAKNDGHYKVMVPGKKFLGSIDWADIDLDDSAYVMQVFPISSLPSDPAGRLQTIQEYLQAGMLTPRQGKKLLDFPDIEAVEGLQTAAEDYLTETLDKIVDDGELTMPESLDDLALARELGLEYYQRGKTQGLEEEKLELLRRFLDQVGYLQGLMQQQAAPPVGAAPGMGPPQAVPQGPPVSPMLPNVPAA